jgi:hypothetical protein
MNDNVEVVISADTERAITSSKEFAMNDAIKRHNGLSPVVMTQSVVEGMLAWIGAMGVAAADILNDPFAVAPRIVPTSDRAYRNDPPQNKAAARRLRQIERNEAKRKAKE